MARYLVYTSPARGHLYPIVPTLLELGRRGHEVHIRTLSSELPPLRDLGFRASSVAKAIEELPLQDWKGTTPEEKLAAGLRTFAARSTHEMQDLECALKEVDPDFLLVDVMTPGAAAVAEAAWVPWAQWIPFFQHVLPFTLTPSGMDVVNAPRERVGLPLLRPRDVWPAPLYLYFTAPPFLPTAFPLAPSVLPVGPGSWEPPWPAPEWIDDLDVPLVLVAISSEFQRDDALVETAVEALSSEDIELVITTAAHDPGPFQRRGRAKIVRWLPHTALLPKAACVVCHGGMGITQKALTAGVPLCVVPFGRDQFEVAQQVERVRAGTWVSPPKLRPDSLRDAVTLAMSMRDGAQAVAAHLSRAGGANAAAGALESLRLRWNSDLSWRGRDPASVGPIGKSSVLDGITRQLT